MDRRLVWDHILGLSESLTALTQTRAPSPTELMQFIESVEEVARDFDDPVEHFPEYALLHYCRSLRRALECTLTSKL